MGSLQTETSSLQDEEYLQKEADASYFYNNKNSSFFKKAIFAIGNGAPPTPEAPKSRINSVMTPAMALDVYKDVLDQYEQKEIKLCKLVSHVGSGANKEKIRSYFKRHKSFDDVLGRYYFLPHDHLYYRYELIRELHDGKMSQVMLCYDHEKCQPVVAKIFRSEKWQKICVDKEMKILWPLMMQEKGETNFIDCMHKNYINPFLNHFVFRGHHVVIMELQSKSLAEMIKITEFNATQIRLIVKQILLGLEFLHNLNIVHGSINPTHIVQTSEKRIQVRIIDFSYSYIEKECKLPLHYPEGHHNYAAPEILMGRRYGKPVDIWGLACTAAELMTREKLFKGDSDEKVMTSIAALLGDITPNLIEPEKRKSTINRPKQPYFNAEGVFKFEGKTPKRTSLKTFLLEDKFIEPLKSMLKTSLVYNPLRRPTVSSLVATFTAASTPAHIPRSGSVKRTSSSNFTLSASVTPVRKKPRPQTH